MRIGFNLLLWTTHVTEEHFPILEDLKRTGYDGVEVPLFEGDVAHFQAIGAVLRDQGLAATGVTVLPDEAHSAVSRRTRRRGRVRWTGCAGRSTACTPAAARCWPGRSTSHWACSPATRRPRPSWTGWSRCTSRRPTTRRRPGSRCRSSRSTGSSATC